MMIEIALEKVLQRVKRADDSVFMKTVTPVGTAEIGAAYSVHLVLALLRGDAGGGEKRMMIGDAFNDLGRRYALAAIERYAERLGRAQCLQHIHVVGQRY